jgi:hypothetical protein
MALKHRETVETKVVWGLGRWLKKLFSPSRTHATTKQSAWDRQEVGRRWCDVSAMMKKNGPENFQSAVINADKLLDYCLEGLGAQGETMGERLKGGQRLFRDRISYQAAWDGHKLRNTLVHDHETEVLFYQAKGAIEQFRKALEGLGAL